MNNQNILITTLGASWAVIPELLHWIDRGPVDFYTHHPELPELEAGREKHCFGPLAELWVVTTSGTGDDLEKTREWLQLLGNGAPELSVFIFPEDDIRSNVDARRFRELVFRVVLHGRRKTRGGKLWLSLAGGRKTMSADIQAAAAHFGCDGLLHVLDRSSRVEHKHNPLPREPERLLAPWPAEKVRRVAAAGVRIRTPRQQAAGRP